MLDVVNDESPDDDSIGLQPELLHMELSECAFYGTKARQTIQTMKMAGVVNGQPVKILLDSGSTHNFIDSRLLRQWGQQVHPTKEFEVMIAERGKVKSSGCCKSTFLTIGGITVQWISTLYL